MPKVKITITVEHHVIERLDALVTRGVYPSRSQAVEAAVRAFINARETLQPDTHNTQPRDHSRDRG